MINYTVQSLFLLGSTMCFCLCVCVLMRVSVRVKCQMRHCDCTEHIHFPLTNDTDQFMYSRHSLIYFEACSVQIRLFSVLTPFHRMSILCAINFLFFILTVLFYLHLKNIHQFLRMSNFLHHFNEFHQKIMIV